MVDVIPTESKKSKYIKRKRKKYRRRNKSQRPQQTNTTPMQQTRKNKPHKPKNASTTLRTLMSGSNLSLFQADFMLSVLGTSQMANEGENAPISVLLSPGRHESTDGSGIHKRPSSATKEFHKKTNDASETFDASSLVFPWQAQMFTSEWNKIVASGVRDGGGSLGSLGRGGGGGGKKSTTKGLKLALKQRKRLIANRKRSKKKFLEEELPPLPNAKDLMAKCTLLRNEEQKKAITSAKQRLFRLYGGRFDELDVLFPSSSSTE